MQLLKLHVITGPVEVNGQPVSPKAEDPVVGAEDTISLGQAAQCELYVTDSRGQKLALAASFSKQSPMQSYAYTPPTYCVIPYYYGGYVYTNICTDYGSPSVTS